MYTIGQIIRNRRRELGLSQEALASVVCSKSTLSRIENGKHEPNRSTYQLLMQRLGLPDSLYMLLQQRMKFNYKRLGRKLQAR